MILRLFQLTDSSSDEELESYQEKKVQFQISTRKGKFNVGDASEDRTVSSNRLNKKTVIHSKNTNVRVKIMRTGKTQDM